jgi:tRNA pseudouridine55 synthase
VTLDGVLVVNKPVGPTSHDVVAAARRALRIRRIGHTGTLDPAASGVLPLVIGNATRLAQHLTASNKEYEATVRFGVETDSYDASGRVIRETGEAPSREALLAALPRFRGVMDQVPPAYSAKKLGGDRAYDLVRRNEPITLAAVQVHVHALDLLVYQPPLARLHVTCSAGFYVRSLAHDLGRALGTGGILEQLVRRSSGGFSLDNAVAFEELVNASAEALRSRMVTMEGLLTDWPAVELTPAAVRKISHGQELGPDDWTRQPPHTADNLRLLSPEGRLVGLARRSKIAGFLHPAVVFRYNY